MVVHAVCNRDRVERQIQHKPEGLERMSNIQGLISPAWLCLPEIELELPQVLVMVGEWSRRDKALYITHPLKAFRFVLYLPTLSRLHTAWTTIPVLYTCMHVCQRPYCEYTLTFMLLYSRWPHDIVVKDMDCCAVLPIYWQECGDDLTLTVARNPLASGQFAVHHHWHHQHWHIHLSQSSWSLPTGRPDSYTHSNDSLRRCLLRCGMRNIECIKTAHNNDVDNCNW